MSVTRSTLALALTTLSACAAAQAPAVPTVPAVPPKPSPAMDALQAVLVDLHQADDPTLPPLGRMDRLVAMRLSAPTEDKLRAAFGTERVLAFARLPGAAKPTYRFTVFPLHYASPQGTRYDWTEGRLDFAFNKAGTAYTLRGALDRLAVEDATTRTTMRELTLGGSQRRGGGELWFGDVSGRVGQVLIENKVAGVTVALNDMRFSSRVTEKPKTVDMAFENRIGSAVAAGEQVDDIRYAVRITNIDKQALVDLKTAGERQNKLPAAMTPAQQAEALKPLLHSVGMAAISRGAALEIDEISARYHGIKAAIKGRVTLPGAMPADLDDIKLLLKKVVARFEIRVPLALVREIAGTVAGKQASAQAAPRGAAADPATIARLRQSMVDVVIGRAVGSGFARVENDVLVSNLEWRDGVFSANGKPVALPSVAPGAQPGLAGSTTALGVMSEPAPGTFLQARLIDGSCTLPEVPDEVVRAGRALRQRVDFLIDVDGQVKDVVLSQPSGLPGYDQAMLDALRQCRYAPALRNGRPIALKTSRETVRPTEAGKP